MTLKHIAEMAGVSVATVSYVINNKENKVSAEVAERIRNIIKETDYQPNKSARMLRSGKSRIIGVVAEDLSVWQTGRILQGISRYAEADGYSVVLADLAMKARIQNDYDGIYQYREMIADEITKLKAIPVSGIIFLGMHDRNISGLISTDLPIVYAYCSTNQTDDVQIGYDNYEISREIVQMLLAQFGGQIGIIGGPVQSSPARQRMAGVEDAFTKAGIQKDLRLCGTGDWSYESGMDVCRSILDSGETVKAFYAVNDEMALGAMREIQKRGLRVPEDICVIGFDDILADMYVNPPLTTVHVPLEQIGYTAASVLTELLETGKAEQGRICLECSIRWRESYPDPGKQIGI